jgi:hypothetical protein
MKQLLPALAALLLWPGALPAPEPEPQQTATLKGTVKIAKGADVPKPRRIRMNDQERHCSSKVKGEVDGDDIVVDPKGNVTWAFVYVKSGLEAKTWPVPKTPVVIQQQTCRYVPHMAGVMVGQDFMMKSGDPVLHIPHVNPMNNKEWGFSQGKVGDERVKQFTAPEVMVRLICDVHQWMEGWIGVLDHPFHAVSGPGGKWEIKNLPKGKYTVEVWHEHYKPVTVEVEVDSATPKAVDVELKERASRLR